MLNWIWLGLILAGVIVGGVTGRMDGVTQGAFESAQSAVTLAIGLIGIMALWLGIMRLAEKSGLIFLIARAISPVMRRLFPDVPRDHPAMGSITMNIAANMLGLGNAATPLGLRAMRDLERLNPHPGTATNAMCMLLAINTSSVQLLPPATAMAVLVAQGSVNPTAIVGTAFLATLCSTIAAIAAVKFFERMRAFRVPAVEARRDEEPAELQQPEPAFEMARPPALNAASFMLLLAFLLFFAGLFVTRLFPAQFGIPVDPADIARHPWIRSIDGISLLAVPFFIAFFPLYAALSRVKVYEEFVEGAKEGFQIAVRIIPFLVAILVAIGMFRGAGGIDMLAGYVDAAGVKHPGLITRPLEAIGFPPDLLPMVIMRPLSGSGTTGVFTELVMRLGPDHLVSRMAATIFGSTETTFYVIAVYFGSVGIRRTRHAVPAGLIADLTGVIASIIICRAVFG